MEINWKEKYLELVDGIEYAEGVGAEYFSSGVITEKEMKIIDEELTKWRVKNEK